MQIEVDILTETPCSKCLIWEHMRKNPVHCDPNECQKLTEWLLQEAQKHQQQQNTPTVKTVSRP